MARTNYPCSTVKPGDRVVVREDAWQKRFAIPNPGPVSIVVTRGTLHMTTHAYLELPNGREWFDICDLEPSFDTIAAALAERLRTPEAMAKFAEAKAKTQAWIAELDARTIPWRR